MRRFALVALILGLIAISAGRTAAQGTATLGTRVDGFFTRSMRNAPPFRPEPAEYDLGEVLGKKPVLFFYFMPQHQGSVNQLIELDKFARTLKTKELAILTASRARDERELMMVRQVLETNGITLPVILDDTQLMMRLGITAVPSYVAVNKDKKIAITDIGSLTHKLQSGTKLADVVLDANQKGSFPVVKGPGNEAVFQLVGDPAPVFKAKDLNGKLVTSDEYFGKKPTVVIFWSALCPHCQREVPRLQEYLNRNAAKVNMVSVTRFNNDDHKNRTYGFVKEKRITFPVLVDDSGINDRYAVNGIPTWVLVDTQGKVSHAAIGEKSDLESLLDKEIARATVAPAPKGKKK